MREYAVVLAGIIALAVPALAHRDRITEKITLRHVQPSQFVRLVTRGGAPGKPRGASLLPALQKLDTNDATNELTATGTPRQIAELKDLVKLLDVAPAQITLEMRLLRFHFEPDGNWDMEIVASPSLVTLNRQTATVSARDSLSGYEIRVSPSTGTPGRVSLIGSIQIVGEGAPLSVSFSRTIPTGRRIVVASTAEGSQRDLRRLTSASAPTGRSGTAYYLQVTATVQSARR